MLALKKVAGKVTLALGLLTIWSLQSVADASNSLEGPALLTVAGKIGNSNRGANDSFADAFFGFHDITFDEAYSFDQKALEALPQHTVTTQASNWPQTYEFEGPLLSDVLAAVGVETAETVTLFALDGYAGELTMDVVTKFPIVLALKAEGEYLGLGGRGPLWLVMPVADYPELRQEGDAGWVWSTFYIEVK